MAVSAKPSAASPDTRAAILDAAESFLQHDRLRNMTVARLMDPMPLTREAFYKHFSSRYEVVAALLERFTSEVAIGFDLWLLGDDPIGDLHAMFDAASHVYVRRARILRAVVDAAPLDPGLEAVWRSFIADFEEAGAERIRADQALGVASHDVDAALAAAAIVHLTERLITQELAGRTPPPREQVVDVLTTSAVGIVYRNSRTDRYRAPT